MVRWTNCWTIFTAGDCSQWEIRMTGIPIRCAMRLSIRRILTMGRIVNFWMQDTAGLAKRLRLSMVIMNTLTLVKILILIRHFIVWMPVSIRMAVTPARIL